MMRIFRHPFVERDVAGMVDHIVEVTGGDVAAAERRLDEVDALFASVLEKPTSGVRLDGALSGWLVRHGGSGHRLTIVFRPDIGEDRIFVALVAFGSRDWVRRAVGRRSFAD